MECLSLGTGFKVRDSSESSKRDFLEKKGLTAEEIDEAFARVVNQGGPGGGHADQPIPQTQTRPWGKVGI